MRIATAVASLALLAGFGIGAGAAPPRTFTASQTRIVSALPVQKRVLRQILSELAPTQIAAVRVDQHSTGWQCGAPPGSLGLTIDAPATLRGRWDALLLSNLYFDAASRLNLRPDDLRKMGSGGDVCIQRVVVRVSQGPRTLAPLRGALASAGVKVVELRRVARGVALTVQTDDPATFLRDHYDAIDSQIYKLSPGLSFFGVTDASGELVAGRAGAGNHGEARIRPDLYACGQIGWSLNPPWNPPPCPA